MGRNDRRYQGLKHGYLPRSSVEIHCPSPTWTRVGATNFKGAQFRVHIVMIALHTKVQEKGCNKTLVSSPIALQTTLVINKMVVRSTFSVSYFASTLAGETVGSLDILTSLLRSFLNSMTRYLSIGYTRHPFMFLC